jgi:diguanylate cyclase (GGDEF)-like protein
VGIREDTLSEPGSRGAVAEPILEGARAHVVALEEHTRALLLAPSEPSLARALEREARALSALASSAEQRSLAQAAFALVEWAQRQQDSAGFTASSVLLELVEIVLRVGRALAPPITAAKGVGAGRRVLVIDEDPSFAAQLHVIGETAGIRFDVVRAPAAAPAKVKAPYDLVFAAASFLRDAQAPDALRALPSVREAPVALLVSSDDVVGRLAALRLRAVETLERPVTPAAILHCARRVLSGGAGGKTARVLVLGAQSLCTALGEEGLRAQLLLELGNDWIAAHEPDAVILDERAQASRDVLVSVRNDPRLRGTLVIVVCADDDRLRRLRALEAGADDAVEPTLPAAELAGLVLARLERLRALGRAAENEPQEGVASLRRMLERLGDEVNIAERSLRPFSLASIELDTSAVSDPRQRDVLLALLARELGSRVRRSDLLSRAGGGELLLLLRECSSDDARKLLESVLESFRSRPLEGVCQEPTFSGGLATYPDHGRSADHLLESARRARREVRRLAKEALLETAAPVVPDEIDPSKDRQAARHVVVADADPHVRRMLRYSLERRGFSVQEYDNGALALGRLVALGLPPIELAIIEMHLPFVNGFEILQRMAENPRRRATKIVLLTSRASDADVVRAFSMGAADHIPKPFSLPSLMARLAARLRREDDR